MNDRKITVRPHFLYVFTLLYPYLTLLIIPVARGLFRHLYYGKGELSALFTAEVIMLLIATVVAVLKLRRTRLILGTDIEVEKGLFCRVRYTVPAKAAKVMVVESNPWLRPLGVYKLKLYTEAGVRRRPDESIPIDRKTARMIFQMYTVHGQAVRSNTVGNVVMSAALSSSLTGLLLAAPAVRIIAGLVGESVSTLLPKLRSSGSALEWLDELGKTLPLVIIVGYIVSFAVLLWRNSGFSSVRSGESIMLDSGRLPHRTAFLEARSVNAVKTVTAPLMRLAGKCAVKFSACGFGRSKGEIGLLVPCVRPTIAKGLVQWLLPRFKDGESSIRPDRLALGRCFFLPAVSAAVTVFTARSAQLLIPQLKAVIWTVAAIIFVVIALWLGARILVLFTGHFSFDGRRVSIKYQYGFGTAELKCPADTIEYIMLRRTPFDKLHGQCSVLLRTSRKNRDTAKLKYLNYREARGLMEARR